MSRQIDDAMRDRIVESAMRGDGVATIATREGISERAARDVVRGSGISAQQADEIRYGKQRDLKARAHGLVLAGMAKRVVQVESGVCINAISAASKPKWWGPRHDVIAERWRKWAVEHVPPELLVPGRTGKRTLRSRGRLCDAMGNAEALEMARQVAGGMTLTAAGMRHGVSYATARRVTERARERGLL